VTARPEPGRPGSRRPYEAVTDDYLIEALQTLPQWRGVGDSLDWDVALFACDVPTDLTIEGVLVPAGLYTREVTGDGRQVIAHRWSERAAREDLLDEVQKRHYLFEHIDHAHPRFVTAHQHEIHSVAARAFAVIESDELEGRPLYDALIGCWDDLSRYVDQYAYVEGLPPSSAVAAHWHDEFVTAVIDRTDTLLHQRDRLLSLDEAQVAGFDGTLRDGSEPRTWAGLTPRHRAAAGLLPGSTAGQAEPLDS
jgi:hypothetical protein